MRCAALVALLAAPQCGGLSPGTGARAPLPAAAPWSAPTARSRALQVDLKGLKSSAAAAEMLLARCGEANEVNVAATLARAAADRARLRPAALDALFGAARDVAPKFKARQLANVAHALAKLPQTPARNAAADAVAKAVCEGPAVDMQAGEVSMACWGFATLAAQSPKSDAAILALDVLARAAAAAFDAFTPKEAAVVAWSMAQARERLVEVDGAAETLGALLEAVRCHVAARGEGYSSRDVSTTAWAAAKLGSAQWELEAQSLAVLGGLEHVFCSAAPGLLRDGDGRGAALVSRDVAQTAAAFATARFESKAVMDATHAFFAAAPVSAISVRDAADALWASARLDAAPPIDVYEKLAGVALGASAAPDALVAVLWAAAVLAHESARHRETALALVRYVAPRLEADDDLRPLHHALLALRACGETQDVDAACALAVRSRAKKAWAQHSEAAANSSKRHAAVSALLRELGTQHAVGVSVTDEHGDLAVDMLVVVPPPPSEDATASRKPRRIAVEFDGPTHFCANSPDPKRPRPLGHTLLKRRLLEARGCEVVSIPYREWDGIPYWASMERKRYLQRKLTIEATLHFSGGDESKFSALPETRSSRFD
ncbi:hypothetical protein M885DRAFT_590774 [Pelagophyceae sp. CCMP2097]|nr:hypothetical protein M885DRAFT_590774 [Pelagophyceae sp. CCMP2097]